MRKIIIFLLVFGSLWNSGCVSPHRKKEIKAKNLSEKKTEIVAKDIPPKENISKAKREYQGKYKDDRRFLSLQEMVSKEKEKTFSLFSQKTGMFITDNESIAIVFQDYSLQDPFVSKVFTSFEKDAKTWLIHLSVEPFITCREDLSQTLRFRLLEVILEQKGIAGKLPSWFSSGLIYFLAQDEKPLLDTFAQKILEDGRTLPEILKSVVHKECPFPDWEGFLAFHFLQNYYPEGSEKLKIFLNRILEEGHDWESEIQEVFRIPSYTWYEKSLHFSLAHLAQKYRSAWIEYRKTLRLYLQKNYTEAIPQWKKLHLQYPDSFMTGNLLFWLGMCYYRIEHYSTALEYFEKILQQFSCQCTHIAQVHYRTALCQYYQKNMPLAIARLDDFIRDFPDHDLIQGAFFYLAQALQEENQPRRAIEVYETFLQRFPAHARKKEALLCASEISMKFGWLRRARNYNQAILLLDNISESEKKKSQETIESLDWIEKNPLDAPIAQKLESMFANFSQKSLAEKKALVQEISFMGKIALPFAQSLKSEGKDLLPYIIDSIRSIETIEAAEFLLEILWQNPEMSEKILLALLDTGIPFYALEARIKEKREIFSPDEAKQILKTIQDISLDVPVSLQKRFPDLLKKLHSSKEEQLKMLQKLIIEADSEQIPVLIKVAQRPNDISVRIQALKNLLSFPKQIQTKMIEGFFQDQDIRIILLAIQALGMITEYPLAILEPVLKYQDLEIKLAVLETLSKSASPSHWQAMIEQLKDQRPGVREKIKEFSKKIPSRKILPVLLDCFIQEEKPLYFYTAIVELIEKNIGKSLLYTPNMTKQQRQEIAKRLENAQKERLD